MGKGGEEDTVKNKGIIKYFLVQTFIPGSMDSCSSCSDCSKWFYLGFFSCTFLFWLAPRSFFRAPAGILLTSNSFNLMQIKDKHMAISDCYSGLRERLEQKEHSIRGQEGLAYLGSRRPPCITHCWVAVKLGIKQGWKAYINGEKSQRVPMVV